MIEGQDIVRASGGNGVAEANAVGSPVRNILRFESFVLNN
jgi:hypothetical protein